MDWMHVGHMGVCRDFCGAILFDICNEGFVHDLDHKLRLLWLEMRSWLQTQMKCAQDGCSDRRRPIVVGLRLLLPLLLLLLWPLLLLLLLPHY